MSCFGCDMIFFHSRSVLAARFSVQLSGDKGHIMAVYLFTLHTYRSWMPNHQRGYVQRGQGVHGTDIQMHQAYVERARGRAVRLDGAMCRVVIAASRQACEKFDWRCHMIAVVWSHVHVLVSWHGYRDWQSVRSLLKRTVTQRLNEHAGEKRQWLSRAGSRKRVRDRGHFDHLVTRYLPSHQKYGGLIWAEGLGDMARSQ